MEQSRYIFNLGRAFADIATHHSNAPALRCADSTDVTYADLARLTNRMARWLTARDIGPGHVVALQNAKTVRGYATMLACLTVGATYTNLDANNPVQRLSRILSVCRPALVLCDATPAPNIAAAATEQSIALVTLPHEMDAILKLDDAPVASPVPGTTPAYIMFTSGSTGVPKGVAIAHASVLNFIAWSRSIFGIGPGDIVAGANPVYFDNSVFDFYSAVFTGACLAPIPPDRLGDARATVRCVDDAKCTVWFSVPSLLIYMMTMKSLRPDTFHTVRTIVFGGEGYPKRELTKLHNLFGSRARLVNVYGPTECTCICSAYDVTEVDLADPQGLPPLGYMAENFGALVLDGDAPVKTGETGELCLLGPQVALGYYNDPDRTATAFTPNPMSPAITERMYRTGDLVRQSPDGLYHFVARKDNQIKHMGYRIELDEIEAALNALPYVTQAAAIYKRIRDGFGHIVAHVATKEADIDEARINADLQHALPPYMLPNRVHISDDLPKNANGKIDRVRLKEL